MNESVSLWPHTGAILVGPRPVPAGARSERTPMWDSEALLKQVLRPLLQVCPKVIVLADPQSLTLPENPRVTLLADPRPGDGPLSALEALLSSGQDTGYLVTACDQPFLTVDLLRQLVAGTPSSPHLFLVPRGTSFHPFPGYYPASLLDTVRGLRASGKACMRDLIRESSPLWVSLSELEEYHLLSVNTPAHLERLQQLAGHNNISF